MNRVIDVIDVIWDTLKNKFSTRKADYLLCDVKYDLDRICQNLTLIFSVRPKTWHTKNEILVGIRDAIDKELNKIRK